MNEEQHENEINPYKINTMMRHRILGIKARIVKNKLRMQREILFTRLA